MALIGDVSYMLNRSQESRLKIDGVLRTTAKAIRRKGERTVYASFSPRIRYNLCCARILQGNYQDWSGWAARDDWAMDMRYGEKSIPFWDGSPVGKLLVVGEQGIGDEVMFASIIPEAIVRATEVTYLCDERLQSIIERSFKIKTLPRYDEYEDVFKGFDAYIPAGDLLPLFRRSKSHFPRKPFLKVDQRRVAEFECFRGRTGISWKGRHGYIDPLELGIENPLSLQYNERHPDIECPQIDLKNDLEGILALCSVLDKVVCVPTSIFHFAGAIDVPTEIIIAPPESEEAVDGIVDQLDYRVPLGASPWYRDSFVYANIKEWTDNGRRNKTIHS